MERVYMCATDQDSEGAPTIILKFLITYYHSVMPQIILDVSYTNSVLLVAEEKNSVKQSRRIHSLLT